MSGVIHMYFFICLLGKCATEVEAICGDVDHRPFIQPEGFDGCGDTISYHAAVTI